MYSSIDKSKLCLTFFLLVIMTSCCTSRCYQESVEIPCSWHTALERGITNDPVQCHWWETLNDPQLTELIEQAICRNNDIQADLTSVETVNAVIAETAKNYLELRGLQQRLMIFQAMMVTQQDIGILEEGLSKNFISTIDQNENKKDFNSILVQKSQIELSIKKVFFHLSTLLGYPPGELNLDCQAGELPTLPCEIPIGDPQELIKCHPAVQEAKKAYVTTLNAQAFYNYQKKILSVLEEAENALALFSNSLEKIVYLDNNRRIKKESYQLTKDLYNRGFKDEKDVLIAYQELLTQEDSLIEARTELLINYVNLQKAVTISCI